MIHLTLVIQLNVALDGITAGHIQHNDGLAINLRSSTRRRKYFHPAKSLLTTQHDDGGYHFEIRDHSIPQLQPSDILVKLSVSGACGSDFHMASGPAGTCREILGHEGVGRIVKLGSEVSNANVGDRVAVAWMRDVCGDCLCCRTDGGETRCLANRNSGRTVDGSFAEYAIIPSRYIISLPDTCTDEEIAPIVCAGVTAYKGIKVSGATPGSWMIISGAGGGVGALGVQYAKAMGYRVLAIDVDKKDYCLSIGAEEYLEATDATNEAVAKIGVVQTAIVMANVGKAYQQAMSLLSPFGTLVCIGIPQQTDVVSFHPVIPALAGLRILGSAVGTRKDIAEAIEFVHRGLVKPSISMAKLEDLTDISKKFSKVSLRV